MGEVARKCRLIKHEGKQNHFTWIALYAVPNFATPNKSNYEDNTLKSGLKKISLGKVIIIKRILRLNILDELCSPHQKTAGITLSLCPFSPSVLQQHPAGKLKITLTLAIPH